MQNKKWKTQYNQRKIEVHRSVTISNTMMIVGLVAGSRGKVWIVLERERQAERVWGVERGEEKKERGVL